MDRDSLVYKAKLAEQAERFDEMVSDMKDVARQPQVRNPRDAQYVGFPGLFLGSFVNARRGDEAGRDYNRGCRLPSSLLFPGRSVPCWACPDYFMPPPVTNRI